VLFRSAIFTIPEIGSVGLTEAEARQQGYDVMAAKFPLQGNGKALIDGEAGGFVKVVSEKKYHEILGIHIVGPHATELTGEAALAINTEARLEDVVDTIHAHPTVAEAVKEAALLALGRQLHC
jgi:dihydrolipoamide dehydrogenase